MPYKKIRGQNKIVRRQMNYRTAKNKRWVVEREQTHDGITDSESCLQGMKRMLGTTLDWCNYRAVSLSIER